MTTSAVDPLDPPAFWRVRLADRSVIRGTLGGILKDLGRAEFEVLATETVPLGVVSVVGVHPFRGTVVFAGLTPSGSVAGWSARVTATGDRPRVLTAVKARAWVKSQ